MNSLKKFRAAVLRDVGSSLKVETLLTPNLSENEALVRVIYSGICASQIMEIRGKRGNDRWLPHLTGHEGIGIVEEVGSRIHADLVGMKVILTWLRPKNTFTSNRTYVSENGEKINSGPVVTLTEILVTDISRLHVVKSALPDEVLALFGCALPTGCGMVLNVRERLNNEQLKVIVMGFGGIGSAAAIALRGLGFIPDVWDISSSRRYLAGQMGFNLIESYEHLQTLRNKYDFCFEATGQKEGIELSMEMISFNGTSIFASHPASGEKIIIDPYDLIRGKRIEGVWGSNKIDANFFHELESVILKSGIDLDLLIGRIFSLDSVNDAILNAERQIAGRTLIRL